MEEPYELEWVNWLAGSTGAAVCWAVAATFTLWALAEALHYVQKEDLRKIQSKKQLSLRSAVFTLEMPCMSGEYKLNELTEVLSFSPTDAYIHVYTCNYIVHRVISLIFAIIIILY